VLPAGFARAEIHLSVAVYNNFLFFISKSDFCDTTTSQYDILLNAAENNR